MNTLQQLLHTIGRLFVWLIIVAPWEQALRIRMGKHVCLLAAGVHLRIPFVDRVYRQSTRRRMGIIRPQTLTTLDGKTIVLSGALGYAIEDLKKLYDSLDDAQDTNESEVASRLAEYVAVNKLPDCTPQQLENHVRDAMELTAYGLSGQQFFITSYAIVRTYRLITGEFPAWNHGGVLNTSRIDGDAP